MDPSFLFFLFLVLLVAIATAADTLSWSGLWRGRRKKQAKPRPTTIRVIEGSMQDRKRD